MAIIGAQRMCDVISLFAPNEPNTQGVFFFSFGDINTASKYISSASLICTFE